MAVGPGKYDDLATLVRERAKADGAIVIVFNGEKGSGFSVQAPLAITLYLAETLGTIAEQMRQDTLSTIIGDAVHGQDARQV